MGDAERETDPFEDEAVAELREYRDRLASLGVLERLTPEQQFTVVDRVWLCDQEYLRLDGHPDDRDANSSDKDFVRIQKVYRQQAPGQIRRLNKKLRALRDAADELIAEIKKIRRSHNTYLAYQIDAPSISVSDEELEFVSPADHLEQLSRAINLIQFPPEDGSRAPTAGPLPTEAVVKDHSMRALYHVFTGPCGLLQNEAEVRVAKIGNEFWQWNLDYTEQYDGITDWKGCGAVRKRIVRSKSPTDK